MFAFQKVCLEENKFQELQEKEWEKNLWRVLEKIVANLRKSLEVCMTHKGNNKQLDLRRG